MTSMDKLLYNKDVLVARIDSLNHFTWINKSLAPLYLQNSENFVGWLENRCIDTHRPNSRLLRRALRLEALEDSDLALEVNAATITDTYWVKDAHLPVGSIGSDGKFTFRPDQLMVGSDGKPVMVNGQYVPKDYALLPKDAMTVDERNLGVVQVGLTQPIYMGGKIRAYNQIAGLSEQLAKSKRSQELQNVILSTDEAYWQIVSLVNRKKLADKYVETLTKFVHDVELMYTTGVATKADVLSVRVKLNEGEMVQTKVDNGLSLSRMLLNQICGLPTDTIVMLKEEMADTDVEEVPAESLERVYSRRPEVASLQLATDIYKKKEKIALSEYLPTIALTANYLSSTPSFFDGVSTKFEGMWSVGVGIKAPIFHWGASRKSLRNAKAQTNAMNYKLQEAKEQIELQVSQSEFKMKEVTKKLAMARKNLERAEENLKFANLGFKEGTIPVLNVLEAQTAWLTANSELIDTQIEARLCKVYLGRAFTRGTGGD